MKGSISKQKLLYWIPGVLLAVFAFITSSCFLRNIGLFITSMGPAVGLNDSEIAQFAAIFEQLRPASLNMPYFLTSICSLAMGRIGCRIILGPNATDKDHGHKGRRIALAIPVWIIA